jgi:hypothetical protein
MNTISRSIWFLPAAMTLLLTGCLVQETVTVNGEVREEDYKFKRPIKEAIENSREE